MDGLVILIIIVVIIIIVIVAWAAWSQSNQNNAKGSNIDGIHRNLDTVGQCWRDSILWTRMVMLEELNKIKAGKSSQQQLAELRHQIGRGYGIIIGEKYKTKIVESLTERDSRLFESICALDKGRLSTLDNADLNQSLIEAFQPILGTTLDEVALTNHLNALDNSFRQQLSLMHQGAYDDAMKEFEVSLGHAKAISTTIGQAILTKAVLLQASAKQ